MNGPTAYYMPMTMTLGSYLRLRLTLIWK